MAPLVSESTREERLAFVRDKYPCLGDCDLCGQCKVFHGKDAEHALEAYIDGREELAHVLMGYRRR